MNKPYPLNLKLLKLLVLIALMSNQIFAQAPNISYNGPQNYLVNKAINPLSPTNTGGAVPATIYGNVTTLAGSGNQAYADGTGTAASFYSPQGVATDVAGNVYVADAQNNRIRKISPDGVVTTLAGSGTAGYADGTGTSASFNFPEGVATDAAGNVYVADRSNNRIRKISPTGAVTTLAGSGNQGYTDGTGTAASFWDPQGVATDAVGNVYVADSYNDRIRKISPAGVVTTLAGSGMPGNINGTGTAASFNDPSGVAADAAGNVYVADTYNNRIRKISPAGVVTTLAGIGIWAYADGTGTAASFAYPSGVATDAAGNVYVADAGNNRIRKITPSGVVTTLAGSGNAAYADGTGTAASFYYQTGISTDASGNVYVADNNNQRIRKISLTGFTISPTTLPAGLSFDYTTGTISGTPTAFSPTTTYTITAYNLAGNSATTLNLTVNLSRAPVISISNNKQTYKVGSAITPLSITNLGGAVPTTIYGQVSTFAGSGNSAYADGTGTGASFNYIRGVATDAAGNVYVADLKHRIRKISPAGVVSTLAGSGNGAFADGTGTAASFNGPFGVATDAGGNVYVADTYNHRIRKISPAGLVTTLAGSGNYGYADGTGTAASFFYPYGVATDAAGNVYVADYSNNRIRKISPAGVVTTLAGSGTAAYADGTGTAASFNSPTGVATDAAGNVYVADYFNNRIRKISPAGVVSTLAGSGIGASTDGTGTAASFNGPTGVATDAAGNVYVADNYNNRIRKISPAGVVTTLAGSGTAAYADGTGTAASFSLPFGLATDAAGNVYVADAQNNRIRKISLTGYTISPATLPAGLSFDYTTGTISGTPTASSPATTYTISAYNLAGSSSATLTITINPIAINSFSPTTAGTGTTVTILGGGFTGATSVTFGGTAAQSFTVISDSVMTAVVAGGISGSISVTTPNGATTLAGFNYLAAPVINYAQTQTFVLNKTITPLVPTNIGGSVPSTVYGQVTTFAGNGNSGYSEGTGTAATFWDPEGVATDTAGNVYVADTHNNRIRKISPAGVVTTLAGSGNPSYANGTGSAASFIGPTGVATDAVGNVNVADTGNARIRKVSPAGVVTTLAGNGAGAYADGTTASFNTPRGVATDASGNVYVADLGNNRIRKISPAGVVTTLAGGGNVVYADGTGTAASFNHPTGVAADATGNVYVADEFNNRIRKISPAGEVTTLAGNDTRGYTDGAGTAASFNNPTGVATDAAGNVYVADLGNNRIRKISPAGLVTTIAGSGIGNYADGTGTAASFKDPFGVATDVAGNVFVADLSNNRIRKVSLTGYAISPTTLPAGLSFDYTTGTISGTPTAISPATTYTITAYNLAGSSSATVTIGVNQLAINSFSPTTAGTGTTVTILGGGFTGATSVTFGGTAAQSFTVISDSVMTAVVAGGASGSITVTTPNGTSTLAGFNYLTAPVISYTQPQTFVLNTAIAPLSPTNTGGAVPATIYSLVSTFAGSGIAGAANGLGTSASFNSPSGVATDASGNLYISEWKDNIIRKITPGGNVTTFAGNSAPGHANGIGAAASFNQTTGIATDAQGNVYVSDWNNQLIRKITPYGLVTTLAGNGSEGSANGKGILSSFAYPEGLVTDPAGNVYVADESNNLIRKITPDGVVSTFAGSGSAGSQDGIGTAASFNYPAGLTIDASGNLYVGDWLNNLIRKITPAGVVSTFAGNGVAGSQDGIGTAASFNYPQGLAIDVSGNIYVADQHNNLIRKITPAGVVTTLAGNGNPISVDGIGRSASFNLANSLNIDPSGNLYVTDQYSNLIRKISLTGYSISPSLPTGLTFDATTGTISGTPTQATKAYNYTITAYNLAGSSITNLKLAVINPAPIITFQPLNNAVYGVADITPGATSSPAETIIYTSSNTNVATITSNGKIHVVGVGTTNITASIAADTSFAAVTPVTQPLTVSQAPLTITADNQTKFYSDNNPTLTYKYAGFVNNEDASVLTTPVAINTTATATSAAGTYPITVSGATAVNYSIKFVAGTLTVNQPPAPTITSLDKTTASAGNSINLTGTYFLGATAVSFGGTAATSFTVNSATSITAIVGIGTSGNVTVTTPSGTGTLAGFNFVPAPTIAASGPTTILSDGAGVTLTANPSSGGYTYQWQNNGVNISGATKASYTTTQSGNYTVIITLNGVSQTSAATTVTSIFDLTANNYHLTVTGETCNGSSSGSVAVTADANFNYTGTLSGSGISTITQKFTATTTFSNLPAGTYTLTFTVDGQANYSKAYTVTITQPQPLSVFATVNDAAGNIELNLSGGSVYHIQVNNKTYTTTESSFTVPLEQGNNALQVTTDRECQGVFTKLINPSYNISPYPMPFEGTLNLNLGSSNIATVSVRIYSANTGLQVFTADYQNKSGVLQLDLSRLDKGAYGLFLKLNNNQQEFKIIK